MRRSNELLLTLRPRESRLLEELEPIVVKFGDVLFSAEPVRDVYFPLDCVISLLAPVENHLSIEVALVGREGMAGISLALGARSSPMEAIVQGSGTALRLGATAFTRELKRSASLQLAIHRYVHVLVGQVTQTAACNTFHSIEARLARWLLMTRDRTLSDNLELTHEFAARMLGVRRVGVTVAAGNLQRRGLITYTRGRIGILDAAGLVASACDCYRAPKTLQA